MQLDPSQFLHHLDLFDMSHEQKIEHVRAVILIMQSFVDRSFGDAPEQSLLGTTAENGILREARLIDLADNTTPTFNNVADAYTAEENSP